MIYECANRRGKIELHRLPDKMSPARAMQRLRVYKRPFHVVCYPDGLPHLRIVVQDIEVPGGPRA